MAKSEHDDLADALARLASGEVAPSEHEPAAPINPPVPPAPIAPQMAPVAPAPSPIPAPPRAVRPAATRPVAPKPNTAASGIPQPPKPPIPVMARPPAMNPITAAPLPATPRAARPAAPVLGTPSPKPLPPSVLRPVAPAMASTPASTPASPTAPARPQRPMAPVKHAPAVVPVEVEIDGGLSTALSNDQPIIDDDDSVIVPAPEASVFAPKPKTSAEMRAKIAQKKSLEFRRTMIPILLTSGVLMLMFSTLKFVAGSDSSLTSIPIWVPAILVAAGLILLGLAAVNMIGVKHQLEKMA